MNTFLTIVIRSILGAWVGYLIAKLLLAITDAYDEFQLRRMRRKTDRLIESAFAPIKKLDQQQW